MTHSKIDKLCSYLTNNKAKTYPIENDMLHAATDFLLNGYLKMLGVILQQSSEITPAQLALYKRIIAGTETEKSAEDYLRMALEIEIEDYLHFTFEIKDLPIKYRFILDAILLTCISEKNTEQIQLVAEFSESLGIEKKELKYITTVAKAILCMDTSIYVDASEIEVRNIPENIFYGYIRLLANDCIIHNSKLTIFQPSCEEDVTVQRLSQISSIDTPVIKLNNVKVNLEDYPLEFADYEEVIFDGCEFIGGDKHTITFEKCENVIIYNSTFTNFNVRTISLDKVTRVKLMNSTFDQCRMIYRSSSNDWEPLGGVIYTTSTEELEPILIDNCVFKYCGGNNSDNYYKSAFISNSRCDVNNSQFINCWHYNCKTEIDLEDDRRTMFAPGSKATRCIYENSAAFCER